MSDITDTFTSIETDPRWLAYGAWSSDMLEQLRDQLDRPIPAVVEELLLATGGGEWSGKAPVTFFHDTPIRDVNGDQLPQWFPGAFAFASDGGSGWYVLDTEDRLGKGPEVVWRLPAGAPFPSEARVVADDMRGFLRWMLGAG